MTLLSGPCVIESEENIFRTDKAFGNQPNYSLL